MPELASALHDATGVRAHPPPSLVEVAQAIDGQEGLDGGDASRPATPQARPAGR